MFERLAAGRNEALYDALVFLASMAAFWLVVPFGDFDTMIGDNVAQVAYWRILGDQAFVGSVGTSSMKPGLILLLGAAYDSSLALFHSTGLIKVVFAVAGAGLAVIVARIARPVGGKIAGAGAVIYLMTQTPVPTMFSEGTSMLVFLPLLLWGVWLFSRGRDGAGAIVLCLAALIRIEAFAVLLWLALAEQLFKRRWRAFFFSSAVVVITIALTVLVYYRVQGSVARFNAGGPPVGYIFAREPSSLTRFFGSLEYTVTSSAEMLFEQCGFPYLAASALLGLAFSRTSRFYLSLFGIPLFLIVYISTGQGNSELRYFQFLAPVTAAFGASGIAQAFHWGSRFRPRAPGWLWLLAALGGAASFVLEAPKPVCSLSLIFIATAFGALLRQLPFVVPPLLLKWAWALLFAAALVHALKRDDWQPPLGRGAFTIDALNLMKHSPVPRGQRVLTEDDLIYSVLVRDRTLFREAHALQDFNIQSDAQREKTLGSIDYILVSRRKYVYYYLIYDPLARGASDPFRLAIVNARRHRPVELYGYSLVPIETSRAWIVLKVEPKHAAS
ncbi:MAG: glycosyltransferase family 87 protein [Pseudomonadota bacterium]